MGPRQPGADGPDAALDLLLGRLFDQIDSSVGLDNTVVVLSADHGSRHLVETMQMQGLDARRVSPKQIQNVVVAALAKRYPGVDNLISHFATDIYLNEDAVRRNNLNWEEVEKTAVEAMLSTGFFERVYTHEDLSSTGGASDDPYLELFRKAFYQPRSPHLNVLPKPGIYVNSAAGGTGHGTAYDADRHVPVVFMGRDIKAGRFSGESGPKTSRRHSPSYWDWRCRANRTRACSRKHS